MSGVVPIAVVTFRQAMRDRVLHLLVGGAFVAIACSKAVGWVTPSEDAKVITDLTLATLSLFSVLVAVVLGGRLIREDVERRTLYTICAKDVSRGAVITGKYFGLLGAFALSLLVASALAGIYAGIMGGHVGAGFVAAVGGIFGELAVLVAASVFFSTVASPMVAAGATLVLWAVGHSLGVLPWFAAAWREGALRSMANVLYVLLPNFEHLDFRSFASHPWRVIGAARIGWAVCSAVAWSTVFLSGAWAVFRSKDL